MNGRTGTPTSRLVAPGASYRRLGVPELAAHALPTVDVRGRLA